LYVKQFEKRKIKKERLYNLLSDSLSIVSNNFEFLLSDRSGRTWRDKAQRLN